MEFQRFIRTHLAGLRLLSVSTENYVPGTILDRVKLRILGHCREILPGEPESSWAYSKSEASMMYGTITANRKMRSGLQVMGLFSLNGGFERGLSVNIELTDIRGASLHTSQLALQPKIASLRNTDRRGKWRQISNSLIVLETFYAAGFTATFSRDEQVITQAELEEITKLKMQASVDYHWKAGRQLVVTQNAKVPFGVRGFPV